jgi:nucleoside-diphosphate-sugar epimerase
MASNSIRLTTTALPSGSLILVTGASGFIGSHIADQLLKAGYRVRGTTRDPAKGSWLTDLFHHKYQNNAFSFSQVEDITKRGAFDTAVQDVQGIIHSASDTSLSPDAKSVTNTVVNGTLNALESASKAPSVKRFVYTSSAHAAYMSGVHGTPRHTITTSSWNEPTASYIQGLLTSDPSHTTPNPYPGVPDGYMVYAASKVHAEQAVWRFVKDKHPTFVVNTALPSITFGRPLDPTRPSSTAFIIQALFQSKTKEDLGAQIARTVQPQYFTDVQDNARLHVAALLSPEAANERLFGCTESFNWNQVLDVFRTEYPEKTFVEDFAYEGSGKDESDVEALRKRSEEVMRSVGYEGFGVGLEESLKQAVRGN